MFARAKEIAAKAAEEAKAGYATYKSMTPEQRKAAIQAARAQAISNVRDARQGVNEAATTAVDVTREGVGFAVDTANEAVDAQSDVLGAVVSARNEVGNAQQQLQDARQQMQAQQAAFQQPVSSVPPGAAVQGGRHSDHRRSRLNKAPLKKSHASLASQLADDYGDHRQMGCGCQGGQVNGGQVSGGGKARRKSHGKKRAKSTGKKRTKSRGKK